MGSLLNAPNKVTASVSRYYSMRKQRCWHYVGDGQSNPIPNKIGHGEKVTPGKYSHIEAAGLVIP